LAKLNDGQIVAAIESEESQALGWYSGELATRRADALNAWLAGPLGNEVEGRSSVVSAAVRDTIESVMPSLCRVFLAGDDIGRFEPISEEDEADAEMQSDVCSWYIERGGGWNALYSAMHDALLLGNGYVKAWWKTDSAIVTETYSGYSEEEATLLLQDPDVEPVEHTQYPLPGWQPMMDPATGMEVPAPMLHDIKVERTKPLEYVALEAVPPDEILVSRRHRSVCLNDADFVQHRRKLAIGDIRRMGYDVPNDIGDDADNPMEEEQERSRYDEDLYEDDTGDPTRRMVMLRETWVKLDIRGSGEAQLWRICVIGKTIIHQEEADVLPLASFAPLIYPHSHIGVSYYDLIEDLTLLETTLQRAMLDNLYLSNNSRTAVDGNNVSLEDLLVSRPGGVVRTDGPPSNSIMPLVHPDTSGSSLQALEWVNSLREQRTGITRYNQGLDANSLNKTASGISMIQGAAAGRQEIIARTIAEGVKDLFLIVHALAAKHSTREIQAKIKNKWVKTDPRGWVKRTDFKCSVALGTGQPEQQLARWQMFLQALPILQGSGLVAPNNIFEMFKEMLRLSGYRTANKYLIEPQPNTPPPQPGPPPEVMAAQAMAQGNVQKAQVDGQVTLQKAQGDSQTALQQEAVKQQNENLRNLQDNATKIIIARMQQATQASQAVQDMQFRAGEADKDRAINTYGAERDREYQAQDAEASRAHQAELAAAQREIEAQTRNMQ
jgi:hypothetical protein